MHKVKEKVALLCVSLIGIMRGAEHGVSVSDAKDKQDKTTQAKYEALDSFIKTTDGKPARNPSLT